jgi:hypothetical protein
VFLTVKKNNNVSFHCFGLYGLLLTFAGSKIYDDPAMVSAEAFQGEY